MGKAENIMSEIPKAILEFVLLFLFLMGCGREQDWLEEKLGLASSLRLHIDVAVDVSAADGLKEQLGRDSVFVTDLIERLPPRTLFHLYAIHAATQWQEPIFEVRTPHTAGPVWSAIDTARQKALDQLSKLWPQMVVDARERAFQYESDILGTFQMLARHMQDEKARLRVIVVLSDMQDVRKGRWNFEKQAPRETLLQAWQREGLIPNLTSIQVFVFRFWPAHAIDRKHYAQIRRFWLNFLELTDAEVKAFRPQREIDLILKRPHRPFELYRRSEIQ